ncbi:MAG: 2-amino-4-hydroxy-6-hydroxymethyldihydropteridine diphosphokinase [Candidatus Omnitrophica bacterium]|nr:2-amino-4-hydroxy-6-hydroxymethyldihydropteridine diphosphokinase [Candidatus Omnitrophota bacterium]
MATAYLGLGSNLGDRAGNIAKAAALLRERGVILLKVSTVIETDPVDGPPAAEPQSKFLNAVVKVETRLSPVELLDCCQAIEQELGRVRTVVNGPRTIDLDILLYDRLAIDTPQLKVPHPRMFERAFVLDPLKEIEPGLLEELSDACRQIH